MKSFSPHHFRFWLYAGLCGLIVLALLIGMGVVIARRIAPDSQWLRFKVTTPTTQVEITSTPTARSPRATPTATRTVIPTSTATPAVVQRIIWNPSDKAVDLFDQPGGKSTAILPNGTWVAVYQAADLDGASWLHVAAQQGSGWLVESYAWEFHDALPLRFVASPDGANLRSEPGGDILGVLPNGSPLLVIESAKAQDVEWIHISTLDDRGGWVASFLVSETP